MNNDRRNFLMRFGSATAATVATAALLKESVPAVQGAPVSGSGRNYVAGNFSLDLEGTPGGWLSSAEGGNATAEVVEESLLSGQFVKKHIGNVKYEDIAMTCGYGMSDPFYDWIQATIAGKRTRKNGSIVAADFLGNVAQRKKFTEALITEIGMPALDAASKDAAKMSIKLAPDATQIIIGGGGQASGLPISSKQKQWLCSNFRLRIDGLDAACSRVNKIDSFTIKQKIIENPVGEMRDYTKEPGRIEFPNLVITFPEGYGQEVIQWYVDFVIKGNCGDDMERKGELQYLASDMRTVLFTLKFSNLGIFRLTEDNPDNATDRIRRLKAEMYCERIEFNYQSAW